MCCKEESPSSKATSVKSWEWYSPRLTGQERSVPLRIRQRRILSRPHDTILNQKAKTETKKKIVFLKWQHGIKRAASRFELS